MKEKIMKKIILISLLLLPLSAHAFEPFMDKCIRSWIGYPLDSVIYKWGYPKYDKNIAGKKLYVWETYEETIDYSGGFTVSTKDKKGNETSYTSGGVPKLEYCIKTLEVNNDNTVVGGHWEGNGCPYFYFIGKKLVNPQNNPWAKK